MLTRFHADAEAETGNELGRKCKDCIVARRLVGTT